MNSNLDIILGYIVRDFMETGKPVGSQTLITKYPVSLSSASVRSLMKILAENGYLKKQHYSSGRVPLAKGFRHFIDSSLCINHEKVSRAVQDSIYNEEDLSTPAHLVQFVSKTISDSSGLSSFAFTHDKKAFYGYSKLFGYPELTNIISLKSAITFLESPDLFVGKLGTLSLSRIKFFIGEEIPFEHFETFTLGLSKSEFGKHEVIYGVLGPMRLDYNKVFSVLDYFSKK